MTANLKSAPALGGFDQPYALISFARLNGIDHADALNSFRCMAQRFPFVKKHVKTVKARHSFCWESYRTLLMDDAACALFMLWQGDDPRNLSRYEVIGRPLAKNFWTFSGHDGIEFCAWRCRR